MVSIREGHLQREFVLEQWVKKFALDKQQRQRLAALYLECQALAGDDEEGLELLATAREMAEILQSLNMDLDTLRAALIYPWVERKLIDEEAVVKLTSKKVLHLLENVADMAAIRTLHGQGRQLSAAQVDNLRRMLMAMVEDVRAVVIKLAERVCYLREIKNADEEVRVLAAREISDIYAPLANRLGIGQLKWELEDISFRYQHPVTYKKIAKLLDQKRIEREEYIDNFVGALRQGLKDNHVKGEVYGRPKHIYSIWKKMQKKSLDFSELFDVRAIRVVVDKLQDCYTALGVVHTLWHHVPSEFDDYVANPKPNGYQSIHTIVVGPEGRTVEIQIRTEQMHQDAELGVAAHWKYKEGAGAGGKAGGFENKIAWLRKILAWQDDVKDSGNLAEEIRNQVFEDRVYVYTPRGDVVDMPQGATPLDFAYYIHSQVGHRCIGAKISGRIVPFTYKLQTGDQVEVLTSKEANPKRSWLNPSLGYVVSSRARSKIQHYFKQQDKDKNQQTGQEMLEAELSKLGLKVSDAEIALERYNVNHLNDLLAALGGGDIRLNQLVNYLQQKLRPEPEQETLPLQKLQQPRGEKRSEVAVEGVGNLLSHMAKCCQPIPGDPIHGFITQGRGVSIHKQDCEQLRELMNRQPERGVDVNWGGDSASGYSLSIRIKANDRRGLLRDTTNLLANEKTNVLGMNTLTDEATQTATLDLKIEVAGIEVLNRLLAKIGQLEGVFEVRRL